MANLVLGLDIGISSVGWGIIDKDTNEIVDAGVRLFEEATRNANEDRRNFRGARRLKRRRKHRLERTSLFLEERGFSLDKIGEIDPYKARYMGLNHELSKTELAASLYHLTKRRGTTIDTPEEDEKTSGSELSTKEQLKRNAKKLEDKHVIEIQYEKLKNNDVVRDHTNRFKTSDYITEAKALLDNQKKYHEEIDDTFIEEVINLINNRRQYYEGPGSKKSPTPYGEWFFDENGELQHESMINKMRGRGTYFKEEYRIPKKAYTAELFNLLNDLNNLRYPSEEIGEVEGLTTEQKNYLIETYAKKGKKVTLKNIAKMLEIPNELDIKGARLDLKKNTPIFTEFLGYKKLKKDLKEVSVPEGFFEKIDLLDQIAEILTAEKSLIRREEQLSELFTDYYDAPLDGVIAALINDTSFKEYHSLSKKAISLVLPELWETNKNQMVLFTEHGLGKSRLEQLQSGNKIQFDDEAILSTVARRAHREAIKITNAVREKHGELAYVAVEMAREKNQKDKDNKYNKYQKELGKFEKRMADLFEVNELKDKKFNGKQMLALKLMDRQDFKCIYSGKQILPQDIENQDYLFEIDHIIPLSYSFDDSQQNKVLCYRDENQDKGQKTPFQYFQSGKAKRTFEEFKVECMNLFKSKKISKKKLNYLLEQRDVQHDEEVQKNFINRNLIDTQYAMRSFSANLRTFYSNNDIDTKVLSIRGSFTSALRRRARLHKDRDASHAHHAIDALIVAAIGATPILKQLNALSFNREGVAVDKETGEILNEEQIFGSPTRKFIHGLRNMESEVKYSHKVDRKPNRTMTNQTLYSTREKGGDKYVVGKVKNIYELDKKGYDSLKKRIDKDPDSFLMAQHDPKTWELVLKVMEEHSHADNPFQDFKKHHGHIKKDGKVPVKGLKYLDNKIGIHVDISHKFPDSKRDVVLLSRKSIRIDVYQNDEGKYKYLGVPYNWFKKEGDHYVLDKEKYYGKEGLAAPYKQIDDSYTFQYSFYKNDRISYDKYEKMENPETGEKEKVRVQHDKIFRGDNNPRQNKLEVEDIAFSTKAQQMPSIGPLLNIRKYNVDVLGNEYLIKKEELQDKIPAI
ncbi:type II CRISPR RNA-guided endonuclease Cas9 [Alkalibacterium gilvum]|uniref:CRISPR-associated endonuclease Cas9 n=1 Tax=Alkalibacterium gilvum TaxID=1130080 RepID=A0A1H6S486_9LACT|nr:type II CRISPR RNA-guided endonuclease Cas9 [Alkalibacterium gilvum]SEI62873.1 CRISPR-associated endonuclease Csn1 [Alkalibacterium gilvum]HAJ70144.1 type II CRISPR RNA-guided endonuclease Cas9 [Alkalibacterium sp.]